MPIVFANLNEVLTIIKLLVDDKTKKHLESLGITVNSKITVLENINGNIIVDVKGVRLALDQNVSTKILVA